MATNLGKVVVTIENEAKRDIKELTRKIGKLTQEIKKLQELLCCINTQLEPLQVTFITPELLDDKK